MLMRSEGCGLTGLSCRERTCKSCSGWKKPEGIVPVKFESAKHLQWSCPCKCHLLTAVSADSDRSVGHGGIHQHNICVT